MDEVLNKQMLISVMADGTPLINTLAQEFGDCHRWTQLLHPEIADKCTVKVVRVTIALDH